MTTMELAQRVSRHLTIKDHAMMSPPQVQSLLQCMNQGMQQFFQTAPESYCRNQFGVALKAPATLSLSITSGSATLSSGTFDADQVGCTIYLDGEPSVRNQVLSTTTLLAPYTGTNDCTATLYYDAIPFTSRQVKRIDMPPILMTDARQDALINSGRFFERNFLWWRQPRQTGAPSEYGAVAPGISTGGDLACIMRVWPLPDREYKLWMNVLSRPSPVVLADLTTPRALPVPPGLDESALVPLVESKLLLSGMWDAPKLTNEIHAAAAMALKELSELEPFFMPTNFKRGTPYGW